MSPDHLDMSRWSESRQLPRNFLVTSWRLPGPCNICYGEVTGKLVPVKFELYPAKNWHHSRKKLKGKRWNNSVYYYGCFMR